MYNSGIEEGERKREGESEGGEREREGERGGREGREKDFMHCSPDVFEWFLKREGESEEGEREGGGVYREREGERKTLCTAHLMYLSGFCLQTVWSL